MLVPDKDPYAIEALPTCNHALSVCLRGKSCSQIFEDFKSNCKAREGKCRMESRWVKTLHHYHSLFYFWRSSECRRTHTNEPVCHAFATGSPHFPDGRKSGSQYLRPPLLKNVPSEVSSAFPTLLLFIIQLKESAECSFWMSIKEVNFFGSRAEFRSLRLCVSIRPTVRSAIHRSSSNTEQLPLFSMSVDPYPTSDLMLLPRCRRISLWRGRSRGSDDTYFFIAGGKRSRDIQRFDTRRSLKGLIRSCDMRLKSNAANRNVKLPRTFNLDERAGNNEKLRESWQMKFRCRLTDRLT